MVANSLVILAGGLLFGGDTNASSRVGLTPVSPGTVQSEPPAIKSEPTLRPIGVWKREIGACHVTLRIENDRLFGTCRLVKEEEIVTLEIEADYSVTKDSVLYGVVSSVEVKVPEATKESVLDARTNANRFIDQPFSIRFRVDEGVLTVKDMKMGGIGLRDQPRDRDDEFLSVIVGRYSPAAASRNVLSVPSPVSPPISAPPTVRGLRN